MDSSGTQSANTSNGIGANNNSQISSSSSLPATSSSSSPTSLSPNISSVAVPKRQQIRAEMVTAAKQFLTNPRVRLTPVAEQTEFLKGKGLSDAEIESAMADVGELELRKEHQLAPPPANGQMLSGFDQLQHQQHSRANSIVEMAKSFLVFGSAGYIFYRFVRSWLLPQLMGIPDPVEERMQRLEEEMARMGESNRAMADTLAQTLSTVTDQNEQISRTLLIIQGQSHQHHHQQNDAIVDQQTLMAEIGIVKSLLLSQNQFPPIPQSALAPPPFQQKLMNGGGNAVMAAALNAKIPAWQLTGVKNGEQNKEDEEEENGNDNTNGNCSADGSEV